ncbi:AAA family ATPase [Microcoleus sp. FACHB-672]|uniref:AAA family ATPase n=1 Tax=Microcoleus sp. FACHB-672 TaxID=2692825 RepID=UPI001683E310|nr:ATP-binding protein [Microcoleus sp. FACHB-672]MBD2042813.1 ATP-binding protein [Microcoleus sp. FACHB-672]
MLIEFSVGNYRSFKEQVTFSMVAANIVSKDKSLDTTNVFAIDQELKLLKSAAIYGANASGKSNLAKAVDFMKWFMINSSKETQSTEKIGVETFRLSTETEGTPSYFELVFLMGERKYRYGFKITQERVISEWLFYVPKVKETKLFERNLDKIKTFKNYNANGIQQKTRSNALFLSVSAQFNVDLAKKILEWISDKLNIISGLHDQAYLSYTLKCFQNNKNKADIIQLIKKLDLGISEVHIEKKDFTIDSLPDKMPDELKKSIVEGGFKAISLGTSHRKFDADGNYKSIEKFDLESHESEGTKKVFALAGALITVLKEGEILIIDEFDARLHPLISLAIVKLFNSEEANPNNAQLIFMTHDTNLLNNKVFRRDQVWFTEKNRYGATDLYSLAEYKIGNDASFESDYIKGRYGAIPYIGNLNQLIESNV